MREHRLPDRRTQPRHRRRPSRQRPEDVMKRPSNLKRAREQMRRRLRLEQPQTGQRQQPLHIGLERRKKIHPHSAFASTAGQCRTDDRIEAQRIGLIQPEAGQLLVNARLRLGHTSITRPPGLHLRYHRPGAFGQSRVIRMRRLGRRQRVPIRAFGCKIRPQRRPITFYPLRKEGIGRIDTHHGLDKLALLNGEQGIHLHFMSPNCLFMSKSGFMTSFN